MLGTKIRKADGLSKRLNWKVGTEKDNENQVFIKDYWLHSLYEVVIEGPEVEILEKIKKAKYSRRKRLWKRIITREVYSKNII